jgi:hypothetical protein
MMIETLKVDTDKFDVIVAERRLIPAGATLVEAYETPGEIIVLGELIDLDIDQLAEHSCDQMGCGSVGGHVRYRFKK